MCLGFVVIVPWHSRDCIMTVSCGNVILSSCLLWLLSVCVCVCLWWFSFILSWLCRDRSATVSWPICGLLSRPVCGCIMTDSYLCHNRPVSLLWMHAVCVTVLLWWWRRCMAVSRHLILFVSVLMLHFAVSISRLSGWRSVSIVRRLSVPLTNRRGTGIALGRRPLGLGFGSWLKPEKCFNSIPHELFYACCMYTGAMVFFQQEVGSDSDSVTLRRWGRSGRDPEMTTDCRVLICRLLSVYGVCHSERRVWLLFVWRFFYPSCRGCCRLKSIGIVHSNGGIVQQECLSLCMCTERERPAPCVWYVVGLLIVRYPFSDTNKHRLWLW